MASVEKCINSPGAFLAWLKRGNFVAGDFSSPDLNPIAVWIYSMTNVDVFVFEDTMWCPNGQEEESINLPKWALYINTVFEKFKETKSSLVASVLESYINRIIKLDLSPQLEVVAG